MTLANPVMPVKTVHADVPLIRYCVVKLVAAPPDTDQVSCTEALEAAVAVKFATSGMDGGALAAVEVVSTVDVGPLPLALLAWIVTS
jgi:hypothetical protein